MAAPSTLVPRSAGGRYRGAAAARWCSAAGILTGDGAQAGIWGQTAARCPTLRAPLPPRDERPEIVPGQQHRDRLPPRVIPCRRLQQQSPAPVHQAWVVQPPLIEEATSGPQGSLVAHAREPALGGRGGRVAAPLGVGRTQQLERLLLAQEHRDDAGGRLARCACLQEQAVAALHQPHPAPAVCIRQPPDRAAQWASLALTEAQLAALCGLSACQVS